MQPAQLCQQRPNSRGDNELAAAATTSPHCESPTSIDAALPSSLNCLVPSAHEPYAWTPVQQWQHGFIESKYYMGTYVNTLSLNLQTTGLDWLDLQLPQDAVPPRLTPRCSLLGSGMILCSGIVRTTPIYDVDKRSVSSGYLSRLPEGMRPLDALPFAALGQEAAGKSLKCKVQPELVKLMVTPDGWIRCLSEHAEKMFIDLSAVRFCLGGGLAIRDEVRLHTCDLPSCRVIMLQGSLAERSFPVDSVNPLTELPMACRPESSVSFVVAGTRLGSHHLVTVKPTNAYGLGAEVLWSDAILDFDIINLSGIMYEACSTALQHSIEARDWSDNRKKLVVFEFQKILLKRYGTLRAAWQQAFDTESLGSINFTKFGFGCKAVGYKGNLFRLWRMFDESGNGEITLSELAMDVGKLDTRVLPALQ
jgi:hypothetical protein